MKSLITQSLTDGRDVIERFLADPMMIARIEQAASAMSVSLQRGGKLMSCGNGGSMCDAIHFAEELSGRFCKERAPLAALAMSDPGHLSCVANDYGYQAVFSRWVEALGRPGDLLLGISTSGNSENIAQAFVAAKQQQMTTVALLGKDGGKIKDIVDHAIIIPSNATERIQEMHIKLIHIFIASIERSLFKF